MTGMSLDLIGAIVSGLGAGALFFALIHALRKAGMNPPKWLLPASIGLTMIGYSIWNDYNWINSATAELSPETEVFLVGRDSYVWAPWTYLKPVAIRYAAIDTNAIETGDDGIRRAGIMLVERRGESLIVRQSYDCGKGMISVAGGEWNNAEDDPTIDLVCAGEGG